MGRDLDKRFKFGQNVLVTLNPSITSDNNRINTLIDKGFRGKENDDLENYQNSDLIKASEFNYLFTTIEKEFKNIYENLDTIYQNVGIADGNKQGSIQIKNVNNEKLQSLRFDSSTYNFQWNIFNSSGTSPDLNFDRLIFGWSSLNRTNKEIYDDYSCWKFIFTNEGKFYSKVIDENNRFIVKNELNGVNRNLSQKIEENKTQIEKNKVQVEKNRLLSESNKSEINNSKSQIQKNKSDIDIIKDKFSMSSFTQFLIEKWKFITKQDNVAIKEITWSKDIYDNHTLYGIYRDRNNSKNIMLVYQTNCWEIYTNNRYYNSEDYIMIYDTGMSYIKKIPGIERIFDIRNKIKDESNFFKKNIQEVFNTIDINGFDEIKDNIIYIDISRDNKHHYFVGKENDCYIWDRNWREVEVYNNTSISTTESEVVDDYDSTYDMLRKYDEFKLGQIWLLLNQGYYVLEAGSEPYHTTIGTNGEIDYIKYKYIKNEADRMKFLREVKNEISQY